MPNDSTDKLLEVGALITQLIQIAPGHIERILAARVAGRAFKEEPFALVDELQWQNVEVSVGHLLLDGIVRGRRWKAFWDSIQSYSSLYGRLRRG